MKPWIALITTTALALSSLASRADDALLALREATHNIEQLSGQFVQVQNLAALNIPLESHGKFRYSNTEGLTWQTLTPIENTLLITPDYQLQTRDAKGKLIPIRTPEILSRLFLGIFSGDTALLSSLFDISPQPTQAGWHLQLIPRQTALASQLQQIDLHGGARIERLTFTQTNGDRRDITLKSQTLVESTP